MKEKRWVALAFLLMTLIGLCTAADYGQPCDEPAEIVILRESELEYSNLLLGENSDFSRYLRQLGISPISESAEKDHGQSAYYLAAPILLLQQVSPAWSMTLWHGYTFLLFMLGVFSLYAIARELWENRWLALLGALLLYLTPRMFAEGHYNNKDMVLLSLVLCTVWLGVRLLQKPTAGRAALFSLVAAFAANTKIIGLYAWGLMALTVLVGCRGRWNHRVLWAALTTVGAFAAAYALLTPAMWSDPVGYFRYLIGNASGFTRWWGVVIFRGARFTVGENPLPRYYLPLMMLVTVPAFIWALAAVGQGSALLRAARERGRFLRTREGLTLCAVTLLWLLPLGFAVASRALVYNGWRHFYFVYGPLLIMAVYGVQRLSLRIRKKTPRRLAAGTLALCLGLSAAGIAWEHPYQYAYYSPVLRNARLGERFELDYWNVSVEDGLKRLYEAEKPTAQIPLRIAGADPLTNLGLCNTHAVLPRALRDAFVLTDAADADYLLSNPTYAQIYLWEPSENMRVAASVHAYGQTLMLAYRVTR